MNTPTIRIEGDGRPYFIHEGTAIYWPYKDETERDLVNPELYYGLTAEQLQFFEIKG